MSGQEGASMWGKVGGDPPVRVNRPVGGGGCCLSLKSLPHPFCCSILHACLTKMSVKLNFFHCSLSGLEKITQKGPKSPHFLFPCCMYNTVLEIKMNNKKKIKPSLTAWCVGTNRSTSHAVDPETLPPQGTPTFALSCWSKRNGGPWNHNSS